MVKIGIFGSRGRMGQAIATALADQNLVLAGGADAGDDPLALAKKSDVLVDFSAPVALGGNLDAAVAARTPIVIGTTGLTEEHQSMIDEAADSIAVLQAANTSLGVTLLTALVEQAAARLDEDWDVEILELHHRHKVDAPSGTALALAAAAARGRARSLPEVSRFDRFENDAPRDRGSIGFASLRGGSAAGDHTVLLATEGERIEITHRAENRDIFARGAIKAALWLVRLQPGRYTMNDVLGL